MAELFEQLLPFKWRDVELPITKMRVSLAHDLVEHKYWRVDGARVEATGLAPLRFSASIPFINGIVPGKGEGWKSLYPTQLRAFLAAFAKRETGVLQHPEFGEIACKAERLDIDWSGDRRGGCEVEASWVETQEVEGLFLIKKDPIAELGVYAQDLDASTADLRKLAPTLPEYETTFADFARGLAAIFDQVGLLSYRGAGQISAFIYRVDAFQDSVNRARSALTWPATQAIERIKAAAFGLRENLLAVGRDIVFYTVPGDTTLAGIAAVLSDTSLVDLVKLNPALMASPLVRRGTVVRYYSSLLPI